MITGDDEVTAKAIAEEIELIDKETVPVTGDEIEQAYHTSKYNLVSLLKENDVFARVSPLQKSMIVEVLEGEGAFVAVVGNGINDIPAMKNSSLGIAMGNSDNSTKDASSIVVKENNFLSILSAVEEGRIAYNKIRKMIYVGASIALAEVLLFIFSGLFELPIPFLAVQILWLNLIMIVIQNIAVTFEKGEEELMEEEPSNAKEAIFDKLLIKETLTSGLFIFLIVFALWYILNVKMELVANQARNYILLLMILFQSVHIFNCRNEKKSIFKTPIKNIYPVIIGAVIAFIIHIIFMNVPFLQNILELNKISISGYIILLVMAIPILIVMEIFKSINKDVKKT